MMMDPIPLYACNLPTICPELRAKHTNPTLHRRAETLSAVVAICKLMVTIIGVFFGWRHWKRWGERGTK